MVSAQVGDLKKTIDFNGDAMNTTSRIQLLCNELNAELLISDELYQQLPNKSQTYYLFEQKSDIRLKGKSDPMTIHKVIEKD